jgi:hypothetical protein
MPMSHARLRSPTPYRVHYAPPAWREVGRMSGEVFEALQRELERLAASPGGRQPGTTEPVRHALEGHGLELHYTWDEQARTLTLLTVARAR